MGIVLNFKAVRGISSCQQSSVFGSRKPFYNSKSFPWLRSAQTPAVPASLWSWQVMIILIREFSTPDEEMKKIVLKAWFADFDHIPSWIVVGGAAWCPGSLGNMTHLGIPINKMGWGLLTSSHMRMIIAGGQAVRCHRGCWTQLHSRGWSWAELTSWRAKVTKLNQSLVP